MKRFRLEYAILLGLCGFLLAQAITTDYHRVVNYLFSDEAVYYMMAQSLAFDRDMEYTLLDLQRVYEEGWGGGPQGVYLTRAQDGRIYYGKYLVYSFFLAPFIAIFGFKGFLFFNVLLLCAMIWIGWVYLRQFNPQNVSLLAAITFFLLSASFLYTFWLTPETFTMFCVTLGLFLWLYRREDALHKDSTYRRMLAINQARYKTSRKHRIRDSSRPPEEQPLKFSIRMRVYVITFITWLFTSPNGRLYLAPIPIAIACASKITNILFLFPILADVALKGLVGRRKAQDPYQQSAVLRVLPFAGRILILGVVFVIIAGMFFGLQYVLTGNYNQYAGDRKMFIRAFPFNSPNDVWEQGLRHTNDVYWRESFFLTLKTLFYNMYYYLFGRFTGMFPYFCCSFLALYYFIRRTLFSFSASPPQRLIVWRRIVLVFTIGAHIAAYIVMAPINYHGGSGAFGNRFFLNIYPAFLFLITTILRRGRERQIPVALIVSWIIGALFLAQVLLNPFQTSYYPAAHAFRFPYRFLPVELTIINALPTHVNPHLMQAASEESPPYRVYFFDENAANFDAGGFWVRGERTVEFAVLTFTPQSHLVLTVTNGPIANQIDISVAGTHQSVRFTTPNEKRRLVFPLKWSMPYFNSSIYPLKIRSHTGFIPKFTEGVDLKDLRYLGGRVDISLNSLDIGKELLEQGQPREAVSILEPVVKTRPDDIYSRYYLGIAYLQAGMTESASRELEQCEALLPEFPKTFFSNCTLQSESCLPNPSTFDIQKTEPGLADILLPVTKRYEAEDLFRATGSMIDQYNASNGKIVAFHPNEDLPGFVTYGPYVEFPPGQYQAKYRLKVGERSAEQSLRSRTALFFDVYALKYGTFLKRDRVLIEEGEYDLPAEYRDYTINFEIAYATVLEFRVETTGNAEVFVDKVEVYPRLPLQVYRGLSQVKSKIGAYKEAFRYIQQVVEVDPYTPDLQSDFLNVLLALKQWDTVLHFIKQNGNFSDTHTGIITYLDPHELHDSLELPESLVEFYNEIRSHLTPGIPLSHHFGDALALTGYEVRADNIVSGDQFSIQYYWKALKPIDENYVIFVHFTKKKNWVSPEATAKIKRKFRIPVTDLFQQDHQPLDGAYPTSKWIANELIRERYDVTIPPEIEPGMYEIWVGVWNPFTETRLRTDGKTKVKIGEIKVD